LLRASCLFSLDHSIRSRQHIWRNDKADLFGGFEIDDQLKLGRLFDRQVGGFLDGCEQT
jgi:hypothetical protein